MDISATFSLLPPPQALSYTPLSLSSRGEQLIRTIKKIIYILKTMLVYALYRLVEIRKSRTAENLFGKENIEFTTANHGNFSELPKYTEYSCSPFRLDLNEFGLNKPMSISPKLTDAGHCFGAVVLFAREYFNPQNAYPNNFQLFAEGSIPFEGTLIQEIYNQLLDTELLDESKEREILATIRSFIGPDRKITSDFDNYYQTLSAEKRADLMKSIDPILFIDKMIFKLNIKNTDFTDYQDVLQKINDLKPGVYQLSLPCFNEFGTRVGGHAIGIIVQKDLSYVYDPNFAIAHTTDCSAIITKLIKEYIGYSSPKKIGILQRIKNVFLGRAHPPSEFPARDIRLYNINPIDNQ